MRTNTIRATEVEIMMYKKLKGNAATRRGHLLENRAKEEYRLYQLKQHPGLTVDNGDLFISLDIPWLAATLDGLITDPSERAHTLGLLEVKIYTVLAALL